MNVTVPSTDLAFGPVKASGAGRDVLQQKYRGWKGRCNRSADTSLIVALQKGQIYEKCNVGTEYCYRLLLAT